MEAQRRETQSPHCYLQLHCLSVLHKLQRSLGVGLTVTKSVSVSHSHSNDCIAHLTSSSLL